LKVIHVDGHCNKFINVHSTKKIKWTQQKFRLIYIMYYIIVSFLMQSKQINIHNNIDTIWITHTKK